jgi:hypothetical protein
LPLVRRCTVRLADRIGVSGQVVHKSHGGKPEGGIAKAAQEQPVPGKTEEAKRKSVKRAAEVAGISPEAKAAVRRAGLNNNQPALIEVAKEPTPTVQVAKVQELADRKARGRRRSQSDHAGKNRSGDDAKKNNDDKKEADCAANATPIVDPGDVPLIPLVRPPLEHSEPVREHCSRSDQIQSLKSCEQHLLDVGKSSGSVLTPPMAWCPARPASRVIRG